MAYYWLCYSAIGASPWTATSEFNKIRDHVQLTCNTQNQHSWNERASIIGKRMFWYTMIDQIRNITVALIESWCRAETHTVTGGIVTLVQMLPPTSNQLSLVRSSFFKSKWLLKHLHSEVQYMTPGFVTFVIKKTGTKTTWKKKIPASPLPKTVKN